MRIINVYTPDNNSMRHYVTSWLTQIIIYPVEPPQTALQPNLNNRSS